MRKASMLLTIIFAVVALLLMAGIAQANFAIHGGYVADTDACAACHRAHTATSAITWTDATGVGKRSALLLGPPTTQLYVFCYICHSSGAPGAATDVEGGVFDSASPGGAIEGYWDDNASTPAVDPDYSALNQVLNGGGFELLGNDATRPATSTHWIKGAAWPAWGKDHNKAGLVFMDCGSCHDPHGSSNYRALKDFVNGHWVGGYVAGEKEKGGMNATAVDPDPLPFVISNELGYPLKGAPVPSPSLGTPNAAPTHGFRLHRAYNNSNLVANDYNLNGFNEGYEYLPSYTWAKYSRGELPTMQNGFDVNRGMSAWCSACHENYMAKVSISKWASPICEPGQAGYYPSGKGQAGYYPSGKGPFSTVVAILDEDITNSELDITVDDAAGFPDPDNEFTKYFGIFEQDHTTVQVNDPMVQGQITDMTIPAFEMVAYNDIDGNTFMVPPGGRGQFQTTPKAFPVGAKVYHGYDADDGYGDLVRHRHPMNVPIEVWQNAKYNPTYVAGDRALIIEPGDWQLWDPTIPFVDIPLDHNAGYPRADMLSEQGQMTAASQTYDIKDWIECLTCHRAHGTDATMSGYANALMLPATIEGYQTLVPSPDTNTGGVPPTNDSALLRADNRGVCERCHNK